MGTTHCHPPTSRPPSPRSRPLPSPLPRLPLHPLRAPLLTPLVTQMHPLRSPLTTRRRPPNSLRPLRSPLTPPRRHPPLGHAPLALSTMPTRHTLTSVVLTLTSRRSA